MGIEYSVTFQKKRCAALTPSLPPLNIHKITQVATKPDLTGFGHKFGRKSEKRSEIGSDKLILETCQVFQWPGGNLS
jgi:hypothetical protein